MIASESSIGSEISWTGSLEEKMKQGKRKVGFKCRWRSRSPHLSLCFQSPRGGDLLHKLIPHHGPGQASGPGLRITGGGGGGQTGGSRGSKHVWEVSYMYVSDTHGRHSSTQVTDGCELPYGCLEPNPDPVQEQEILTTEPPVQLFIFNFIH